MILKSFLKHKQKDFIAADTLFLLGSQIPGAVPGLLCALGSGFGKIIYTAILNIIKDGKTPDLLAVSNYLKISGDLEKIGGAYFLTGLTEDVISSGLITQDAERLIDFAKRRRVYFALTSATQSLKIGTELPEVTESVLSAFQMVEHKDGGTFKLISDAV